MGISVKMNTAGILNVTCKFHISQDWSLWTF